MRKIDVSPKVRTTRSDLAGIAQQAYPETKLAMDEYRQAQNDNE